MSSMHFSALLAKEDDDDEDDDDEEEDDDEGEGEGVLVSPFSPSDDGFDVSVVFRVGNFPIPKGRMRRTVLLRVPA